MAFSAPCNLRSVRPAQVSSITSNSTINRRPSIAVSAALSLRTSQPPLSTYVELEVEYATGGRGPVTPTLAPPSADDNNFDGCITYGVATTSIPGVKHAVPYCDPMLGQWAAKNTTFDCLLKHEVTEDNIVGLTMLALHLAMSVASMTPSGTTCASARSLSLFLFMERVITVSKRDYMGPQALSRIIDLMSYFKFSPSVSSVLLEQHQSLAATAAQTLELCAAYEPSAIDVDMVIRGAEARARAPTVLGLNAVQSGVSYTRMQMDFYKVSSDAAISAKDAARLVVASAKLEVKFPSFSAHSQQMEYLAAAIENDIEMLTLENLEATSGAAAALSYVPARVKFSLLHCIVKETIRRLSQQEINSKKAGGVLAVALHTAATLHRARAVEELHEEILEVLADHGFSSEVLRECTSAVGSQLN